jgi:hypothetical protein
MARTTRDIGMPGVSDLGSMLADQVDVESEETKKKRLAQLQQARLLGMAPGASALGLGTVGAGGYGT